MNRLRALGALIGAGLLTFAMVGAATATAPPPPAMSITKAVDHSTLPAGGGTVTYTIVATATTGTFHQVVITDANCDTGTLAWVSGTGSSTAGPTGAGAAGFLHEGDSWTFSCTRALTAAGTYHNTASADGCVDGSVQGCNQGSHASSGQSNDVVVTVASGGGGNGSSNQPPSNQPPTDTAFGPTGTSGPADSAWLLIVALGALLGGLVVLNPSRVRRRR